MKTLIALLFVGVVSAGEVKLGKPLTLKETTPIAQVAAQPDQYAGKMVQVKGKVTEVCQMMGCWTNLVDESSGKSIRIKVNDGEIVFPKDSVGKTMLAEGELKKIELTKEQAIARAKHEAEEQKRKFDPKSVKGAVTIVQLQGTGAVLYQ
jgi:hypothetical protein